MTFGERAPVVLVTVIYIAYYDEQLVTRTYGMRTVSLVLLLYNTVGPLTSVELVQIKQTQALTQALPMTSSQLEVLNRRVCLIPQSLSIHYFYSTVKMHYSPQWGS